MAGPRVWEHPIVIKPLVASVILSLSGCLPFFDVSPDGKKMVYVGFSYDKPRDGLFVSGIDGSDKKKLVRETQSRDCWILFPSFSPDSSRIAFIQSNFGNVPEKPVEAEANLWAMRADGSEKKMLAPLFSALPQEIRAQGTGYGALSGAHYQWSPDGKWIVFHDMEQVYQQTPKLQPVKFSIFRIDLESGKIKRLTSGLEGVCNYPTISPDGKKIAYVEGFVLNADIENKSAIWQMNPDGTDKRKILQTSRTEKGIVVGPVAWSPDGRLLAFATSGTSEGKDFARVWLMDPNGGHLRALMDGNWINPQWSPNGKNIIWQNGDISATKVRTIVTDADGKVVADFKDFRSAKWLPDGVRLVLWRGGNEYVISDIQGNIDRPKKKDMQEMFTRAQRECISQGRYEEALSIFKEAAESSQPRLRERGLESAMAVYRLMKDYDGALTWGQARFEQVDSTLTKMQFLAMYVEAGRFEEAVRRYEEFIRKLKSQTQGSDFGFVGDVEHDLAFIKEHSEHDGKPLKLFYQAKGLMSSPFWDPKIRAEAVNRYKEIISRFPTSSLAGLAKEDLAKHKD